ncbi:MAG: anti-sigma-D factor RsdA [Mycobacterium sp.]
MPDFGGRKPSGGDPSLNEINRADRFLDALAAKQPVYSTDPAEAELAFLLSDWRDTVRDPAPTVPVTARDAVSALNAGLTKRHSRGSLLAVGSTAAALLCIGGFGAAIYGADPGDTFYGARTALFGTQRVSDDQVMLAAQTEMQQVETLIDQGQWEQAQDKLQQLSPKVQSVDAPEHKQQLIEQWNALTYKVVEQNPAATLPPAGEPLPLLPSSPLTLLPVPVIVPPAGSSSTSSTTQSTSTETTSTSSSADGTTTSTPPSSTSTSALSTTETSTPTSSVAATPSSTSSSESASSTASSPSPSPSASPSSTASSSSSAPSTSSSAGPSPSPTTSPATNTPTTSQAPAAATSVTANTPTATSVTVTQTTTSTSPTAIPSPVTTVATTPSREISPSHGSGLLGQLPGLPTLPRPTSQH